MKREEVILQTTDVKVRLMSLEPGEGNAWHRHTEITDTMFGIAGEVVVRCADPEEEIVLSPGVRCTVTPGRLHRVENPLVSRTSQYLLIQGVGSYDFIPREPRDEES